MHGQRGKVRGAPELVGLVPDRVDDSRTISDVSFGCDQRPAALAGR
jgi:hypothetical protein